MLALDTGGKGSTEPSVRVAAELDDALGRAQARENAPLNSSRHRSTTARR